jgi:predicted phage terminase large subunit-like protein
MPATKAALLELTERWPKAGAKLVEDKANGPAVIQELKHDVAGLIAVTPEGGKIARAHAVSPAVEAGNVYLPHPALISWVDDFLEETAAFPNGRHDDQVDAMTQALRRLRESGAICRVPESDLVMNPFRISPDWPCAYGLAIQPNGVAALWGAKSYDGTIYLYAEHQFPHAEPSANARAIQRLGSSIPGIISGASLKGSQDARNSIAQVYRQQGLNIQIAHHGEEAAEYQLRQMLATHKIRVFASLAGFLEAYRIGDEEAPLMRCCQALIPALSNMRLKPTPPPPERQIWDLIPPPRGPLAWMS